MTGTMLERLREELKRFGGFFDTFILEDKKVVAERDVLKWSEWFVGHRQNGRVKQTNIRVVCFKSFHKKRKKTKVLRVSTVFLGLNHGTPYHPLLFETMVFDGNLSLCVRRCETWAEAEEMHKAMCEEVRFFGDSLSKNVEDLCL